LQDEFWGLTRNMPFKLAAIVIFKFHKVVCKDASLNKYENSINESPNNNMNDYNKFKL